MTNFRVHFNVKGVGPGSRVVPAKKPDEARRDVLRGLNRDFNPDCVQITKVKVAA